MSLVPDIQMRTNDQRYMRYVEIYFDELFSKIKHLLRGNGGPLKDSGHKVYYTLNMY